MEHTTLMLIAEAVLRVILGWRFLISGLSNVGRWPNPVQTASILFPRGATFFGLVATLLMVVGGLGVAAGLQTPLCSAMQQATSVFSSGCRNSARTFASS